MSDSLFFPGDFKKAELITRPNRFVVKMKIDGQVSGASLPNPGKLGELFLPGAVLYVRPMTGEVKYPYRVIAVESGEGEIVMLDTHTNNTVARYLIDSSAIPSLKGYKVKRAEVTVGKSRFDFLLENNKGEELYCEVKSCTLFGGKLAMFPDAVTSRGRRHVKELAEMADQGIRTAVLFIVQSSSISFFSPDYHTDPDFSQTLYESRDKVQIIPIGAGWDDTLNLTGDYRELEILWNMYEKEGIPDAGHYMMLFFVDRSISQDIDQPGYYLLLSSEKNSLGAQVEKYKRKKKRWDNMREFIRHHSSLESTWIIRSTVVQKEHCINSFSSLSDQIVYSDDEIRLCFFAEDPRTDRSFQDLIIDFRMKIPLELLKNQTFD